MDLTIQDKVNTILWKACDTFRGVVDASDYKNYVLTMLFMKYLSDLQRERGTDAENNLMDFVLPEECRFSAILEYRNTKTSGLGAFINQALKRLEEKNPEHLAGVFMGVDFDNLARLGREADRQARLENLVDDFKALDLRPSQVGSQDVIGNAYEFLIARFAAGAGKKAGEFYTPHCVSLLITTLMNPKPGDRICDPTCGSGSLLIHCGLYIKNKHRGAHFELYGQEVMGTTWPLAKMNMLLHGMKNATIEWADTLRNPKFKISDTLLSSFDIVVANPPFSLDKWGYEEARNDPFNRFFRGMPPKARADYAFLSHMIQIMAPKTGRVGVVTSNGVLFRGGAEKQIRKAFIEENLLDAVIGLPGNMFYGTSIPAAILIFRRKKQDENVFFIDASERHTHGRNQNRFSEQNVAEIASIYRARQEIEKEAVLVSLDIIRENGYNLNIPRYLDRAPKIEPVLDEDIIELNRSLDQFDEELAQCRQKMNHYLRDMGYDF